MNNKIRLVITDAPVGYEIFYFEWFLLGFYELAKQKEISLSLPKHLWGLRLRLIPWEFANRVINRALAEYNKIRSNFLRGYILDEKHQKITFCIDCSDSPFLFSEKDLCQLDIYFKMQCPKIIENKGFSLTSNILIPWCDVNLRTDGKGRKTIENIEQYSSKIKPLMVGPRRLSFGLSYRSLKKGYFSYLSDFKEKKSKKIMCYFGNAKGPIPAKPKEHIDYDAESELVSFFAGKITHPNEKRSIIAEYLNTCPSCDGRIINPTHSDTKLTDKTRVVPLKKFCQFISDFSYNINVSGYRLSIPNRFIESFIVGTGIITDKLACKWYLPFSPEEVKETVPMGYEPMDKVDWEKFRQDIQNISQQEKTQPAKIRSCFEQKWAPIVVGHYILDVLEKAKGKKQFKE